MEPQDLPEWLQRDAELTYKEMRVRRWQHRLARFAGPVIFVALFGATATYLYVTWKVLS